MKKVVEKYYSYPLDGYATNFDQRFFFYLSYGFLVGMTTFISLNILGIIRGYPVIQAFQGMYSWHTTLNFTICLIIVMKVFRFFRWRAKSLRDMKITDLWLIGISSFVIAFVLQRTVVFAGVQNYNPTLIDYYNRFPEARPTVPVMLAWCLLFWVPLYCASTHLVIWKQKRIAQHVKKSDQPRTSRWVLDGGKVVLNRDEITHISMEDHYARIWWQSDGLKNETMVRLSMKEIVEQLPQTQFIQIHRSHLINLEKAQGLVRKHQRWVVQVGDAELPVSRTRFSKVKKHLRGEINP